MTMTQSMGHVPVWRTTRESIVNLRSVSPVQVAEPEECQECHVCSGGSAAIGTGTIAA